MQIKYAMVRNIRTDRTYVWAYADRVVLLRDLENMYGKDKLRDFAIGDTTKDVARSAQYFNAGAVENSLTRNGHIWALNLGPFVSQ